MLKWLSRRATRSARRVSANKTKRTLLRLESLESREVPAILIQVDYTYDTGFFKNNPEARAVIERVAGELGNSISANLSALAPSGTNTWTASFYNPATGGLTSVANMSIGANTIKLFVGARTFAASEAGVGGPGGYGASGTASWLTTVQTRNWSGFAPWGGTIAFDAKQNWYFGSAVTVPSTQLDFYSVATHELGHVLGIGTSTQWKSKVSGGKFYGANADALYGAPVPVSPDGAHWADGITVGGQPVSLDPTLNYGTRVNWSALDRAAMYDLGWGGPAPAPAPVPPTFTRAPVASTTDPVGFAGAADGAITQFILSNGVLTANGQKFIPFAGYRGMLRIAGADFNGDGYTDYAVATGFGPQSVVAIVNGRDGSFLVNQTVIFQGFRGGLFIAAGDIDGDGKADLAVSADGGAGPHIQTFRVVGGNLVLQSSFFAFDDPNFRGGVRVALGDINHDGFADLVVTTGGKTQAKVGIYSGTNLRYNRPTRLTADFVPYVGFSGALNAAVGDMDGDGLAELALSPDQGTVAHIKVWSGSVLVSGAAPGTTPPSASFYAFPTNDPSGARLAMHDLDGDGRKELIVASGNPKNSAARAFTFAQVQAGGGGAPTSYPIGSVTINGLFAGLHTTTTDTTYTASADPVADDHDGHNDFQPVLAQWSNVPNYTDENITAAHVG